MGKSQSRQRRIENRRKRNRARKRHDHLDAVAAYYADAPDAGTQMVKAMAEEGRAQRRQIEAEASPAGQGIKALLDEVNQPEGTGE